MLYQEESLLMRTRNLLQEASLSYLDIYKATGLPPSWLSGIATAKVRDPSVNKVQRLYEFLSGTALKI